MTDVDDQDHQSLVDDLVVDLITPDPYPISRCLLRHGNTARRSRLIAEEFNRSLNPSLFATRQPPNGFMARRETWTPQMLT